MKFKLVAVAALIFSQLAWGAESDVIPAKPQPMDSAIKDDSILASALRMVLKPVFDGIEKALQNSGLEFDVCSYVSYQTQTTTSAKGMSECLNMNFTEGITNKGDVGITYIWLKSQRQETLPIRIDWRPAQEGLFKIARELFSLWTEKESKDPTEEKALPYSQNILGQLRLTFPAGTRLADFMSVKSGLFAEIEMAKQVEFSFSPINKVGGYANYHGVLTVTPQEQSADERGNRILDFKTNINFLKMLTGSMSRKYKIKGTAGNQAEEAQ